MKIKRINTNSTIKHTRNLLLELAALVADIERGERELGITRNELDRMERRSFVESHGDFLARLNDNLIGVSYLEHDGCEYALLILNDTVRYADITNMPQPHVTMRLIREVTANEARVVVAA